jgi:sirohydrochlorin ferrochelatase
MYDRDMSTILLVDNGSTRKESTLNLRRLARELGSRIGREVHPVSLMHSDKIPASELDNQPAQTFETFMRQRLGKGEREFIILPLFFGKSRALTRFIPDQVAALKKEFATFTVKVAEALCPLPKGESRLTGILFDNVTSTARAEGIAMDHVILVDHGSPIPEVTAVREFIASQLQEQLGPDIGFSQAVMERRAGREYDFNGDLLEDALSDLARRNASQTIILAMMFFSPGRHAGPGGDIEDIYRRIETEHPGLRVYPTPLIGTHPGLIDILQSRLEAVKA